MWIDRALLIVAALALLLAAAVSPVFRVVDPETWLGSAYLDDSTFDPWGSAWVRPKISDVGFVYSIGPNEVDDSAAAVNAWWQGRGKPEHRIAYPTSRLPMSGDDIFLGTRTTRDANEGSWRMGFLRGVRKPLLVVALLLAWVYALRRLGRDKDDARRRLILTALVGIPLGALVGFLISGLDWGDLMAEWPLTPLIPLRGAIGGTVLLGVLMLVYAVVGLLPKERAFRLFGEGQDLTERGEFAQAVKKLTAALELEPFFPNARVERGFARLGQDDVDGALADFSQAIPHDPAEAPNLEMVALAFVGRAIARYLEGDDSGAVADCDDALRLFDSLTSAMLVRAVVQRSTGKRTEAFDEAVSALRAAHRSTPRFCKECPAHVPSRFRLAHHVTAKGDTILGTFKVREAGEQPQASEAEARVSVAQSATSERERQEGLQRAHAQNGLAADLAGDTLAAKRHYQEVVSPGPADLVEYAWASARLREIG